MSSSTSRSVHCYDLEEIHRQDGFGITHAARDTNLGHRVAIKEYYPRSHAIRTDDGLVQSKPGAESIETYYWGLDCFLEEARTLARFEHPNIVSVHSVFEAYGTAYMVMDLIVGRSVAELLEKNRFEINAHY